MKGIPRSVLVAFGDLGVLIGRQQLVELAGVARLDLVEPAVAVRILVDELGRLFERFVDVKGIGPRKALKALAEPVRKIAAWIEGGDAKALSRLPGIGSRASELIIATLKGKLADLAVGGQSTAPAVTALSSAQRDALDELIEGAEARVDSDEQEEGEQ